MLILKINKKLEKLLAPLILKLITTRNRKVDAMVEQVEKRRGERRDIMNQEIEDARSRWEDGVEIDQAEVRELQSLR